MRIGLICQYFPPEVAPIGVMVEELAQDLTKTGNKVTIFTGYPNHPDGKLFSEYKCRINGSYEELSDGIILRRNWLYISKSKSFTSRILNYLSFACSTIISLLNRPQDIYLVVSPPLTNIIICLFIRLIGRRYVLNIQDIYPDAAITAGELRNATIIKILKQLEMVGYRCASYITVISKGFRSNLLSKGVMLDKLIMIPNWINAEEITPRSKLNPFSINHQTSNKFVVLYSGTIGLVSGAGIITNVAELLKDKTEIVFMLVGQGPVKRAIEIEAEMRCLKNIRFLPFQTRELLPDLLSSASVGLVTIKPGYGGNSVPSKILGYMAAGRPVIASVDPLCDTWNLVTESNCGLCVLPGDPVTMANAIRLLHNNTELARRLGMNGRSYLTKNFHRATVTNQYAKVLCNKN